MRAGGGGEERLCDALTTAAGGPGMMRRCLLTFVVTFSICRNQIKCMHFSPGLLNYSATYVRYDTDDYMYKLRSVIHCDHYDYIIN